MDEEEMRCGMSCRFHRSELMDLQLGGKLLKTLIRVDGLKHRNITCAFMLGLEEHQQQQRLYSLLFIRSFDVSCECSLSVRVRIQVMLQDELLREVPWQEEHEFRDDSSAIRLVGLLGLEDFEGTPSNCIATIKVFLDVKRASPEFLMPPRVPTFSVTALCDEEQDMVTLNCSDGSVQAQRAMLSQESACWRSELSHNSSDFALDCKEFNVFQLRAFLFFLQSRDFYEIARFDTFHSLVKIATRYSVRSVLRRCSLFVNECLLLDQTSRVGADSSDTPGTAAAVCSRVRWGLDDLLELWDTTVTHLGEDYLGAELMTLICISSYSDIVKQPFFKSLSTSTKSIFYHQYLLCQEGFETAQEAAES